MKYKLFGKSGLRVSEIFLGTMTFGGDWRSGSAWGTDETTCRAIFEAYAEAGGNVIDTANRYTDGDSERIVGELVASNRDRFVLSTKYTVTNDGNNPNASGNHRRNLVRSLEQSLRRLRTDCIDILWVHIWDARTPIEETVRALDDVVRAGKALYLGISDAPAWVVARANTLAELRGWTAFCGLQVPYNLVQRDVERELLPMAQAFGLSVTAWSPLAGGLLSGKYLAPQTSAGGRIDASQISARDRAIALEVKQMADELGVSPSRVALAWVMAQSPSILPIIGARTLEQLRDNLEAVDLRLSDDMLERLDQASAIDPGFPTDMIERTRSFVYGAIDERVEASRDASEKRRAFKKPPT